MKKVILLGSGGLSIGQAGEFDYSGTQAVKSLVEEKIQVIVVNPNIATVQTNPQKGLKVYLYPVTSHWVTKVIQKERPDGIIGGFGGQTALNCLIALDEQGILKEYNVKNLGTSVSTLKLTEDRKLFAEEMQRLQIATPPSHACHSVQESLIAANKIGYPVIARAAYALGGLGSGFANNDNELSSLVEKALTSSPQVLVEKSLKGWKEVEYEVMRDRFDNTITICNMENFDPLGIHTGDSIVVTPSQSLNDHEYQLLRNASLKIIKALQIIGECNAQFALCPKTSTFYIIEVNARLSRSSALASKASGYPIAYIASKVVLGHDLLSLRNPVTKITSAFYEPSLDYVTVKFPRWDLNKFQGASQQLDSTMKSVGEIMAIGRNFPEALQKAVRMITEDASGINSPLPVTYQNETDLYQELENPTDKRLYALLNALRQGIHIRELHHYSCIDKWFLHQLQTMITTESEIMTHFSISSKTTQEQKIIELIQDVTTAQWWKWKQTGFSDEQLALLASRAQQDSIQQTNRSTLRTLSTHIRKRRKELKVCPVVKKIDTTSAEYPSPSNYLYLSYEGTHHDKLDHHEQDAVIVLGGGAYRIGTSVEFDWCAVSCSEQLKKHQLRSIMINCNPETVSTDYNHSDRLFFEELTVERILDIADFEKTKQVIACMGGQLPNKLATELATKDMQLLGHSARSIEQAEDRKQFSHLLDQLDIQQPKWIAATDQDSIDTFIDNIGFPVLIRPSFVLSGAAMKVAHDKASLTNFIQEAATISREYPVVISEFITGAREIEVDGVAKEGTIVYNVVSEHIENAGIHSGDATTVVPAQKLYVETVRQIKTCTAKIAKSLSLNGPFNIQFLAKENQIKVIECNARSARSFPFVSKVMNTNLAKLATNVILNKPITLTKKNEDSLSRVGVKAAMFSFSRLKGADPITGVEMASTGEVGCLGDTFDKALLLALEASKITRPLKGVLISAGPEREKLKFYPTAKILNKLKIPLYGTEGTASYLKEKNISIESIGNPKQDDQNVMTAIKEKRIDLIINIPKNTGKKELTRGAMIRKAGIQYGCSLLTNMEKATAFIRALENTHAFHSTHQPVALND